MSEQAHFSAIVDMGPAFRMPVGGSLSRVLNEIRQLNSEPEEGDKSEAVDLVMGALALFYARGGDQLELVQLMQEKLK
jgi:hypothetical protein